MKRNTTAKLTQYFHSIFLSNMLVIFGLLTVFYCIFTGHSIVIGGATLFSSIFWRLLVSKPFAKF